MTFRFKQCNFKLLEALLDFDMLFLDRFSFK